jgi:hypothetical protein
LLPVGFRLLEDKGNLQEAEYKLHNIIKEYMLRRPQYKEKYTVIREE